METDLSRVSGDRRGTAPLRVLHVEAEGRGSRWTSEMLRICWDGPLVITHVEQLADAIRELTVAADGCIIFGTSNGDADWCSAIQHLRNAASDLPMVVIGDSVDDEAAVATLRAGAQDYLCRERIYPARLRRAIKYAIERKQTEVKLAHRALHDVLTELPNRALFLDRLGVALDRARRSGGLVAVLFLDVDNFKEINDTRGHASGDRILVELAERLRMLLRPMDTVARFGGDEFTFLFEDLADEREVVLIAERIARSCSAPIELDHGETTSTVSMGIAMVNDPRMQPETVIREADAAMYRAKERGGGRYELFDESTRSRALERVEMEIALRHALSDRQLRVHYLPSVSLTNPEGVVGLEALLRWEHPERGLISAEEFIPLAEETGLVLELGQYVIREVLNTLSGWQQHRPQMTITVNLSSRELEDLSLVSTLSSAIRAAGIEPGSLCLEVAESTVTRNPSVTGRVFGALKEIGVKTAIDDFGTGAASVLALRELPVDSIKLHGSLLAELDGGAPDPPVLGAVVELAHALGLLVVAEGVETKAQAQGLRALGCDGAQGYLFYRPVPAEDVESMLDDADGEALEYALS